MEPMFDFGMRIAPRWDALAPALQEHVREQGLQWPSDIRVFQFAKMYALFLAGHQQLHANVLTTQFGVLAWEPPTEVGVAENLTHFSQLHLPLGVRRRKTWTAANANRTIDFDTLAPVLAEDGLILKGPRASKTLTAIPYQTILNILSAIAYKKTRLKVLQSDHIVEHLEVPSELNGFKVSHWRGDASHRLTHAYADLEVWVKPHV